jgi:anti-sigma factor RsiW
VTCRELADFIMAYLDGELDDGPRAAFERHLGLCPNCVEYLRQYRETVAAGRRAFADEDAPASDAAPEALVQTILAARGR